MARFKWTRKRYERASQLSRLFGRIVSLPMEPPFLLKRFWELMGPMDAQHDRMDPSLPGYQPLRRRIPSKDDDRDGIPF